MLRIFDNPAPRFPPDRPLAEDIGSWQVAYTRSRQEKALAHELARQGVSYYLPLFEKRTRRRDNKKTRKSLVALFGGYLAFSGDEEVRQRVLRTNRALRVLAVGDQEQFVQEME